MALVFTSKEADINYLALSTDIVDSTIDGLSLVGGILYTTDDSKWYIVESDLTLSEYTLPISISGGITVGAVDQGAASLVSNWRVNIAEGVMLTDDELRATPVSVSTGLSQPLTDTELRDTPVVIDNGVMTTVDGANSSTTPLLANASFIGVFKDLSNYSNVSISVSTDVNSETDGLKIHWSSDGINIDDSDYYSIFGGFNKQFTFGANSKYIHIEYVNGASPQTYFRIQTLLHVGSPKPSSHKLDNTVVGNDDAELVKSVITGRAPDGSYKNVGTSMDGILMVGIDDIQADAGSRVRISQLTTLGDYKILGYDRTVTMWDSIGTGTGTYLNNKFLMSVTAGQYFIRQTKKFHPYFSGKSQMVEETFDQFAPQANVTKKVGYFSSNAVAPHQSTFDGFWLESGNGTISVKSSRAGIATLSVNLTDMSGYSNLAEYKTLATWDNFTVVLFDFLWLGGAILRLWVKTSNGFILAHQFNYAGTSQDVFILSPNQPLRYEIVSTTGTGSFRYICAQVASEGSINEMASSRFVDTGSTLITTANNGTTYPVKAIKKQIAYRDVGVLVDFVDMAVGTTQDLAKWSLHINPTLSAPLTYSNLVDSPIAHANGNGTITATAPGTVIAGGYIQSGVVISQSQLTLNYLTWLGSSIANVMDEYVLCVTPVGGSLQTVSGLGFKIY